MMSQQSFIVLDSLPVNSNSSDKRKDNKKLSDNSYNNLENLSVQEHENKLVRLQESWTSLTGQIQQNNLLVNGYQPAGQLAQSWWTPDQYYGQSYAPSSYYPNQTWQGRTAPNPHQIYGYPWPAGVQNFPTNQVNSNKMERRFEPYQFPQLTGYPWPPARNQNGEFQNWTNYNRFEGGSVAFQPQVYSQPDVQRQENGSFVETADAVKNRSYQSVPQTEIVNLYAQQQQNLPALENPPASSISENSFQNLSPADSNIENLQSSTDHEKSFSVSTIKTEEIRFLDQQQQQQQIALLASSQNSNSAHQTIPTPPTSNDSWTDIKEQKRFYCTDCRKTYASENRLFCHRKIFHEKKPVSSTVIETAAEGKQFYVSFESINNIPTIKIENKPRPLSSKRTRTDAIADDYPPEKETRPMCSICKRSFSKPCYLVQHNNSIHATSKLYRCTECGKKYAKEEDLLKHLKHHSAFFKQHKCDLCPKAFAHRSDLKRHQIFHAGNYPLECEICQKKFIRRDHLSAHMKSHQRLMNRLIQMNRTSNKTTGGPGERPLEVLSESLG